jgi:hypothetical protein
MDSYYPIEIKICSKNGWSTPQEAKTIWSTPYARTGVTVHWWGGGEKADKHDSIVNYMLGQAAAGNKSCNYVVSDNKITLMVSPDNVAWCSNNGNPTTISVEHQPTLGAAGYKKSGWLLWQLEGRYKRKLQLFPHSHWTSTSCPGTIDMKRIRAEADKWKSGGYTPAPAPKPPVPTHPPAPTITITYSKQPKPVVYKLNKNANLWDFNSATWDGFKAVKQFKKGDIFTIFAIADNHNVGAKYGVTEYSFTKKIPNGINMVDLDLVTSTPQPIPIPPPVQNPEPAPGPSGPTGPIDSPSGPSGPTPEPTPPVNPDWKALVAAVVAAIAALVAAVGVWIK